jgi:hypothetical protein
VATRRSVCTASLGSGGMLYSSVARCILIIFLGSGGLFVLRVLQCECVSMHLRACVRVFGVWCVRLCVCVRACVCVCCVRACVSRTVAHVHHRLRSVVENVEGRWMFHLLVCLFVSL